MMENIVLILVLVLWFSNCLYFELKEWEASRRKLQQMEEFIQEQKAAGEDPFVDEQICMHGSCLTCHSVSCYTGQIYRKHGKDAALAFLNEFETWEEVDDEII